MENRYILAVDQSTSATKAVLFNRKGELVHRYNAEHRQFYPKPGWVEHDAEEIYEKTIEAIHGVVRESGISFKQLVSLSIANQRETALIWDRNTGRPIYHAVVWQCQRGNEICRKLQTEGYGGTVAEKTGLVISPYFSAAKLQWLLDHVEGARERAEKGELLFGTMDAWLVWKLTGGMVHATDYSNASRTQLFNINTLQWDPELFDLFAIPLSMAPEVKSSDAVFGYAVLGKGEEIRIPISGVMGDSHAALFGQGCFSEGMAKATYGTGSSIMMNIGGRRLHSGKGLVTSLAWGMGGKVEYVLEGNINCTGATVRWLADNLGLIPDARSAGKIAASVEDNAGVYLVPAFVGLGAPYWDSEAKATLSGMTMGMAKAHIVRAAEESIAYQIKDILDLMALESDIALKELRVDGGPTRDNFLMQFQADMLKVPVVRSRLEELSAAGSAYMAGLSAGYWSGREEVQALRVPDVTFESHMEDGVREKLHRGWKEAVRRTLSAS